MTLSEQQGHQTEQRLYILIPRQRRYLHPGGLVAFRDKDIYAKFDDDDFYSFRGNACVGHTHTQRHIHTHTRTDRLLRHLSKTFSKSLTTTTKTTTGTGSVVVVSIVFS